MLIKSLNWLFVKSSRVNVTGEMKQKKHHCGVIGTPTRFLKNNWITWGDVTMVRKVHSDRLFFIYLEFPR